MVSFTGSIVIANLKIFQFSNQHSIGSVLIVLGSIIIYVLCHLVISKYFVISEVSNSFSQMYTQDYFWLAIFLIVITGFLLDL